MQDLDENKRGGFENRNIYIYIYIYIYILLIMKIEDQKDATIRCLLLTSVSTCFGYHYTHLQENKGPVTAFGVLFWFCWMWLVAVVGRCLVGCEHYMLLSVFSGEWCDVRYKRARQLPIPLISSNN